MSLVHKHKKRIQWLDFLKGVAILFVVLGHALGIITVYNFGITTKLVSLIISFISIDMSIFFVISGYLYKPSNTWLKYKTLLYKKSCGFIIPYIIFSYVVIFSQHIKHFISLFYENGLKVFYLPTGYTWFLYTLFIMFILIGLMDLIHLNMYVQLIISIVFFVVSSKFPFMYYGVCADYNPIPRIGEFMICFYIGMLIKRFNISKLLKKYNFTILFLVLFIIFIILQNYLYGKQDVNNFKNDVLYTNVFIKLLGILFMWSMAVNFNESKPIFKYFCKYGKGTLLIYLVHLPLIYIMQKILIKISFFNNHVVILGIFQFVVAWLISIFIYCLSKKNDLLNFIFYPRKFFDRLLANSK